MSLSTICFCIHSGKLAHRSSAERLLWTMKTPPCFSPATGFECSCTLGSGESTTSTYTYSQLTRIGSGAADR